MKSAAPSRVDAPNGACHPPLPNQEEMHLCILKNNHSPSSSGSKPMETDKWTVKLPTPWTLNEAD